MGKIYDFVKYIKRNQDQDDRDAVLELAVLPSVEDIIAEAGMMPMAFKINTKSYKEYNRRLITDVEIDGTTPCPYYDFITKTTIYRIETVLDWLNEDEFNEFEVRSNLYRLENYKAGNRIWLFFDRDSKEWEEGPGEDFFDLNDFDGLKLK